MFVECLLSYKDIFEFGRHTGANFAVEMWLFKMLSCLFIIIEVDIFELLWVFVANEALLMRVFKMPFELIDIIEGMFAKGACGMEKDKISIFA